MHILSNIFTKSATFLFIERIIQLKKFHKISSPALGSIHQEPKNFVLFTIEDIGSEGIFLRK